MIFSASTPFFLPCFCRLYLSLSLSLSRSLALMALSSTPGGYASILRRLPTNPGDPSSARSSLPFRLAPTKLRFRKSTPIRASTAEAPSISGSFAPAVSLTEKALNHLTKMRNEKNEDLCLRIGVKQGGCSGMSYTMEFENRANSREDDSIIEYNGFTIVCDSKSLLFLYGMQLDFSDALIGGGFNFKNPNASKTCGCGKSFASGMQNETEAVGSCNDV